MFTVVQVVEVDDDKCIGCKRCDQVCPTGAIKTTDGLAQVKEELCTGCNKCITECYDFGAIASVPLESPRPIKIQMKKEEQQQVDELCKKARMQPWQLICPCTFTLAYEAATAIVQGVRDPIEISEKTGVRSTCSIWCTVPIMRLLDAADVEIKQNKSDWRVYTEHTGLEVGLWNISDEVADRYPEYRLKPNKNKLDEEAVLVTCFGAIGRNPK